VVTGLPPDVTLEVKVTDSPTTDGFFDDVSAVVVGLCEVIVRHQPPLIDPASPLASSTTHRLQVPFADAPLNVDRPVADVVVGAGDGNAASAPVVSRSVGRKMPDANELPDTGP